MDNIAVAEHVLFALTGKCAEATVKTVVLFVDGSLLYAVLDLLFLHFLLALRVNSNIRVFPQMHLQVLEQLVLVVRLKSAIATIHRSLVIIAQTCRHSKSGNSKFLVQVISFLLFDFS